MELSERRLGDRIIFALELAVEQEQREIAEYLRLALEEAMTRIGGAGVMEKREVSERMMKALEGLDQLRQRDRENGESRGVEG